MVSIRGSGTATVYDLAVADNPEYFANGILVHNSFRDGVAAYKEFETTMPKADWVNERVATAQEAHEANFGEPIEDVNRLMQIARMQSARYEKEHQSGGGTWTAPRAGSMRHRPN